MSFQLISAIHRIVPSACLLFVAIPAAKVQAAAGGYPGWSDSSFVYMNTSASGINLASTVTGFPLLVRLRAPDFPFQEARGNGQDLRFANAAGVALPYEIDTWDSAGGRADVWVLVDTVRGNDANQFLRMYWGNPSAASESNGGAVFTAAGGMHSVWHLGGTGTGPRPNAVTGGIAATPANYDGDESRAGVIGLSDSLDGGAPGDHLDIGDGYANWTAGFTFSAWVRPTASKTWARILDFGNGADAYNIIMGREGATDNFTIRVYGASGSVNSIHNTPAFFTLNQWQHVIVTYRPADSALILIRNGALFWSGKLGIPIANTNRTQNFLGRSNWSQDQYWQGNLDEVRLDRVYRGPAWNILAYQNQRDSSVLVTFRTPPTCQERFAVPRDTAIAEGTALDLVATADCATAYTWSVASGLQVRILDPATKSLSFSAPRVVGDTQVTFRFEAVMAASSPFGQVRVRVLESIPEPRFTLPDSVAWGGRDSLVLGPAFTNLAAVKASRDSVLTFRWTLASGTADTAWRGDSLVVRRPDPAEPITVRLCVDNRGPAICDETRIVDSGSVGVLPTPRGAMRKPIQVLPGNQGTHRLDGRRLPPSGLTGPR